MCETYPDECPACGHEGQPRCPTFAKKKRREGGKVAIKKEWVRHMCTLRISSGRPMQKCQTSSPADPHGRDTLAELKTNA